MTVSQLPANNRIAAKSEITFAFPNALAKKTTTSTA
jgi:hypothetical protein